MSAHFAVLGSEIPNNQSLTGEFDLAEHDLFAFAIPSTFTGSTLTFQSKTHHQPEAGDLSVDDAEAWRNVHDTSGTEVSITVAANRIVVPTAAIKEALAPLRYLRIRCGTSAAPVNQSPTQALKIIAKRMA